ncbi:MAG TPA: hypothetical protein VLU46_09660, partial [Thermoanaerobaculia bacterium]|nr:hypothetical protein [Thermoanaerobaculia bacterium]
MQLGIENFTWSDLSNLERLNDLSKAFDRFVETRDAELFARFRAYGDDPAALTPPQESALLIDVSKHLGAFLAQMFGVDPDPLKKRAERDTEVAKFKYNFVQKRVAKISGGQAPSPVPGQAGRLSSTDPELDLAVHVNALLEREKQKDDAAKAELDQIANSLAAEWKAGRFEGWTSFNLPKPLVYNALVPEQPKHYRRRDVFHLTDNRQTARVINDQSHYCIWCHERQKDSCA